MWLLTLLLLLDALVGGGCRCGGGWGAAVSAAWPGLLVPVLAVLGVQQLPAPAHRVLDLLRLHRDLVQCLQIGEGSQHRVSVILLIGAGVLLQPEVLELGQVLQVQDLPEVRNLILPHEQLDQVAAVLKVLQRPDLVHAQ